MTSIRAGLAAAVTLGLLTASLGVDPPGAQPPNAARVGVLASSTEANFAPSVQVFREALHAIGWVEGRNLTLDVRYAGEQYARLSELAAELIALKVDVLASMGTPATLAAKRATTTIPIVMESLSDVVSTGIVSSLARPGGNVTGVSGFAPDLIDKRLELIREILPRAERITAMANRANPVAVSNLHAAETAAQQLGIKLRSLDVRRPSDLDAAFETMRRERTEALVLVADPFSSARGRGSPSWRRAIGCRPYTRYGSSPRGTGFSPTGRSRGSVSSAWRSTWIES